MKKYELFKIVQLSILAVFLVVCVTILLTGSIKQLVFSDRSATFLFYMVWVMLLANFIFIFVDLHLISQVNLSYNDLYEVAYADSLGSIPNRFSCDTIIEKYADEILPDGIGCMMLSISNLVDINKEHGRKAGNQILKDFSNMLTQAAGDICFVGRNGGNKFLAVFEDCDNAKFEKFLSEVERRISAYNKQGNVAEINYKWGQALSPVDEAKEITELIALSDKRLMNH